MSESNKQLVYSVVGGLPEPSGGVTVFNGDLVEMLLKRGHNVIVFDQNSGQKQSRFYQADIRVSPTGRRWYFNFWVAVTHLHLRADRFILHTSNTFGLIRVIVPLLRGMTCTVFFHNGEIEAARTSSIARILLRWLMSRIDRVFVMSPKQYGSLSEKGYPMERISRIVPVIRSATRPEATPVPLQERPRVIMACGHETRIYNYEFAVRLAQEVLDTEVHIYLYGTHVDSGYLDDLKSIDTFDRLRVFRGNDRDTFVKALCNARLFVRPNHVDSYGVSVVDALQVGTPVVASDVCARTGGSVLFAAGDYDAFRAASMRAMDNNEVPQMDELLLCQTHQLIDAMIREDEANAL